MHKTITILGATGSIGQSTLDVVARHANRFTVHALTANRNADKLLEQIQQFQPEVAVLMDANAAKQLASKVKELGLRTEILSGQQAIIDVAAAAESSYVMAAIVGAAGLLPSLAAVTAGKHVLLANKEALVMSGQLFIHAVQAHKATLLPIDSEHNAIFQCLPANGSASGVTAQGVEKILLTASGGPFRQTDIASLNNVSPEQACAHPNWCMGRKVSVDSATMMNKGLEVIEAHWLFGVSAHAIEVVIHPQSVIHSLVAYSDGSVLAQLGNPDMRTPIAHALAWPDRFDAGVAPLDLTKVASMDFQSPDFERFPCLRLAYDALSIGGSASAILNAANEIAVEAFLNEQIRFTDIANIVADTMEQSTCEPVSDIDTVLQLDQAARATAMQMVKQIAA